MANEVRQGKGGATLVGSETILENSWKIKRDTGRAAKRLEQFPHGEAEESLKTMQKKEQAR